MPNTLLTVEEVSKRVFDTVREVCNGDEKLMRKVMESLAGDFMSIDMNGKRMF